MLSKPAFHSSLFNFARLISHNCCLDDKGRLYLAETDGRNLKKDQLLNERPCFIRRLEDTMATGEHDIRRES
jgi:hypothetical protein